MFCKSREFLCQTGNYTLSKKDTVKLIVKLLMYLEFCLRAQKLKQGLEDAATELHEGYLNGV
jgi:hypothetical protein